jgi:dTDP-4-dehydrorhamnose reductase
MESVLPQKQITLIVGADGLIGSHLLAHLSDHGSAVIGTSRRPAAKENDQIALDLANDPLTLTIPCGIQSAVLCAAMTGYVNCDSDPLSQRVNVSNTVALAGELMTRGVFVVFLSTNAVFSGDRSCLRECDAIDPVTSYGRQKGEAEKRLRALAAESGTPHLLAIVRLTKVISTNSQPFFGWLESLSSMAKIRPFSDLNFSPISIAYVINGLERILQSKEPGTHHLSGAMNLSYADFARKMAVALQVPCDLVKPIIAAESNVKLACKPEFAVLDMKATTLVTGLIPEPIGSVISCITASKLRRSNPTSA